jgi:hypothetical protein
MHVLLVSRGGPIGRLLRRMLTAQGYAVEAVERANDGAAARALREAHDAHGAHDAQPACRSVVVYEATTPWGLSHDASRFFALVARQAPLRRHAFVLLAADVEDLPAELRDLSGRAPSACCRSPSTCRRCWRPSLPPRRRARRHGRPSSPRGVCGVRAGSALSTVGRAPRGHRAGWIHVQAGERTAER